MSVERHAREYRDEERYQEVIRQLQGELSGVAAENRMLRGQVQDLTRMVYAQQEAARIWQQAAGDVPRPRRDGRPDLRVVRGFGIPAAFAAAGRVLRSKLVFASTTAAALLVVALPPMHHAEFRGHVPGPAVPASAVKAAHTQGPPGQDKNTPPPGEGHGPPSPAGQVGGSGQPQPPAVLGQDTPVPAPSPDPAPTDTPAAPAVTPAPAGTPSSPPGTQQPADTPSACPHPGR